ncbi:MULTISPECIES: alkylmercury lyase [unclassified Streptomyces]|uniref:alkylmercury lyase n=1 Tax=unclassified Streptomyces TaxID=2593676 RepID=UPI001660A53A|nr:MULTISPECIES: alkylmercury lyase [unclassified Streptomyces]MBD0710484.1 hypothetical protein [Streptomyces sp. CBMA291]MBD0717358.1 hypothetical protein [Streptomyces sp. CBMA370]
MRITVLTVPDCPNVALALDRVTRALDGRAARVEVVEVLDLAQAVAHGMTGSPTILLDGVDPFAPAGATPSVSCRLYRDGAGRVDGAPSVTALREAFEGASAGTGRLETTASADYCATDGHEGRGGDAAREGCGSRRSTTAT